MSRASRAVRIAAYSLIAAGITLVGFAAASGVLFTQTFPSVPNAPPGSITSSCATLQAWDDQVPAGGGPILFNCTTSVGAFVVANAPATATPTFTLPTNASDLYVLPGFLTSGGPGTGCSSFGGAIVITNSSQVTFGTSGPWDYCVDATGSLAAFSVTWS